MNYSPTSAQPSRPGLDLAIGALFLLRADGNRFDASRAVEKAFGANEDLAILMTKGAVAPGTTADGVWGPALASDSYSVDATRERIDGMSAFGAIKAAAATVPFDVGTLAITEGATGNWRGEARPIKVSRLAMTRTSLKRLSVGTIVPLSQELLRTNKAAATLRRIIERTGARMVDEALLDPTNAGIPEIKPAAVTYGAPSVSVAGGDIPAGVSQLLAVFEGNLDTALLICHPRTAASLGLYRATGGERMFPGVGVRGGEILGMPLISVPGCPLGIVVIVDPMGLLLADEGIDLDTAKAASLELDDTPAVLPTAATVLVNLWQRNLAALKLIRYVNWTTALPGSTAVLTGVASL